MIYLAYVVALLLGIVALLAVLIILMQRPSANAGMGAALGGGAAESVFGGDSANVLSKLTYTLITLFFVLSFGLYLGFIAAGTEKKGTGAIQELTKDEIISTPTDTPALAPATEETAPTPEAKTPEVQVPETATPETPAPEEAK